MRGKSGLKQRFLIPTKMRGLNPLTVCFRSLYVTANTKAS